MWFFFQVLCPECGSSGFVTRGSFKYGRYATMGTRVSEVVPVLLPEGIFLWLEFRAGNGCCALASKENIGKDVQSRSKVNPRAEAAEAEPVCRRPVDIRSCM